MSELPAKLYTCPMAEHADVVSDKPGYARSAAWNWWRQHGQSWADRGRELAQRPQHAGLQRHHRIRTAPARRYAQRHHRFLAAEQVHRSAHDARRWCWAAFSPSGISRSMPFPTSRTCRSSSTPSGQARPRRSCRTRSPIRSRPKCFPCPQAKVVRGYSFYGFSFVYVIFEDGTDPYWARSRVLEYLSSLGSQLPKNVTPSLGPGCDGRRLGVHVFPQLDQPRSGGTALDAGLVSEIPTHLRRRRRGGRIRRRVREAISGHGRSRPSCAPTTSPSPRSAWPSSGATAKSAAVPSSWPKRNSSCACAATSQSLDDLRKVAVGVGRNGVPILLGDVANVQLGPDMRRGIAELNGEGETVGGIVVVRYGANARAGHSGREETA